MIESGKPQDRLILGTMRLHENGRSAREWASFFADAYDLGVRRLHSSYEYDSYALLREALDALRDIRGDIAFRHVVKLADPGFDDTGFDAVRFTERVQSYCEELGCDSIDDVQWMWRNSLDDDDARVAAFEHAYEALADTADTLRQNGSIGRLLCFPYTPQFAFAAIDSAAVDGLAVYRNVMETDYDGCIAKAHDAGKPTLVIRPLNAGKALSHGDTSARALFDGALDCPGIEAGIVSTSAIAHLRALLD